MMRFLRLLLGSAALPLALVGCSREAESVPPPTEEVAAATGAPWEHVPADSIYGATPVENLATTPVELDLLNLPDGWRGCAWPPSPTSSSASGARARAWRSPPPAAPRSSIPT